MDNLTYGVASNYAGGWEHTVYLFDNLRTADEWLRTEQGNFTERELMKSKAHAIRLAGRKAVQNADYWEW